jgi:hypothetical protein
MLRRFSLLVVAAAFSLAMCFVPVSVASAAPQAGPGMQQQQPGMGQPNSPSAGSQMPQQMPTTGEQQPGTTQRTHHQKAQVLNGTIAVQSGHYVFKNTNNNTTLRVSNPKKVKKYAGDNVQVKGKINEQAQTIHVSKVKVTS